jgi:hypothetical protein
MSHCKLKLVVVEFLVDCNMCMLNGRTGGHDFTNISSKGKSVVDYVLTPHEHICDVVDFRVHVMSDVVTRLDLLGYESVPDDSLYFPTCKFHLTDQ